MFDIILILIIQAIKSRVVAVFKSVMRLNLRFQYCKSALSRFSSSLNLSNEKYVSRQEIDFTKCPPEQMLNKEPMLKIC